MHAPTVHRAVRTLPGSRLMDRLVRGWVAAQRRRRIARTARSLETLSDAHLDEIGIPRDRIRAVAAEVEDAGRHYPAVATRAPNMRSVEPCTP